MRLANLFLPFAAVVCSCSNNTDTAARKEVKQYTVDQFYDNRSISGAAFNKDESAVLVQSNGTGIFNLYELGIADTALKPLTHSTKESFFAVDYLPGTSAYIYSADQGGNENNHLYLQHPGDTSAKDLTPWPNSQNNSLGWSHDKKTLYFTSNHRDPRTFDVWKADTADWKPQLVYRNDSAFQPGIVSPSGHFLTLTKLITTDRSDLYLYDLGKQRLRRISTGGEATWNATAIEKNDSILYYITNLGDEFAYLVRYNIVTGKSQKLYSTNWDVVDMNLSENEKYYTVSVNANGKNNILVFDHATGKPVDFPEMAHGTVNRLQISPTEKNMLLTMGSSKSPNNLYVYNFADKQLK